MSEEKKTAAPVTSSPLDPGDFYVEGGFIVFTREYHLKRGFCCKSGCRHCPWEFRKTVEPS